MKWLDMPNNAYKDTDIWTGEFEENFCNIIDPFPAEGKPMCFTSVTKTREACDVRQCRK